jgi:hypothetical protein
MNTERDKLYQQAREWLEAPEYEPHPFKKRENEDGTLEPMEFRADWKQRYDTIVGFLLKEMEIFSSNPEKDKMARKIEEYLAMRKRCRSKNNE